jgi:sulfofructose kinase
VPCARVDGHQPNAAIHYAKACREAGILSSLDGGGLRSNTYDLLGRAPLRADAAEAEGDTANICARAAARWRRDHGSARHALLSGNRQLAWDEHFRFARAAAAHAIPHLGNEASLPSLAQIKKGMLASTSGARTPT